MVILATKNFKSFFRKWKVNRDHKSQIRNRTIGEVRELTVEKENEIREESLKKGISKGQEMAMTNLQLIMKNTPP